MSVHFSIELESIGLGSIYRSDRLGASIVLVKMRTQRGGRTLRSEHLHGSAS